MSVWRRQYRTDRGLWLMGSLAAFGALGALLRVPIGKDEALYWQVAWAALQHAGDSRTWLGAGPVLGFWGLVLAAPAAGVGWVVQAVVRMIWPRAHPAADTATAADYAESRAGSVPDIAEPGAAADRAGGRR